MESIIETERRLVAAFSASTLAPAIPEAPRETDNLVWWLSSKLERSGSKLVIHHDLTDEQRGVLKRRYGDLKKSLTDHNRNTIAADIGAMLGCYPQFVRLDPDEAKKLIAKFVHEMKGIPTWAISRACYQIRMGAAPDVSKDYMPTTIRVRELAQSIVKPMVGEVIQIERILVAQKYQPPSTPEERERVNAGFAALLAEQKESCRQYDAERVAHFDGIAKKQLADNERRILREYARTNDDPVYAGDVLVSPSLVKQIEELERERR